MIDFATLQGLTIPEGVVTQITDASGRVLWMVGGGEVILEVEKITSQTYAAETVYENEEFILLDIYPKSGGTVNVTYGGLTKTITDTSGATEPNAQQVFFGTFNGASDSVATPASGTLTIEGDYAAVGVGAYAQSKMVGSVPWGGLRGIYSLGSIEYIPSDAFIFCEDITSLTIPSSVTSIGEMAFGGCTGLTSLTIPSRVTSIGKQAFNGCTGLTSISIPPSVTSIGMNPWDWCSEIITITVMSGNTAYASDGNCLIEIATNELVTGCMNSIIPSSVTSIGGAAFRGCTGLTSLTIPSSVTSIGEGAFRGCTGLTSLTIPSRVTSIGKRAFQDCTGLTSVVIPASVTIIGDAPWTGCANVETFTVLATTPPAYIKEDYAIFAGTSVKTVIVPKGCIEAYQAAEGWSSYANYMTEAS